MADGSLTIDTQMDTKGLNKGVEDVTKAATEAGDAATESVSNTETHLSIMNGITKAISGGMLDIAIGVLGIVAVAALLIGIFVTILTTVAGIAIAVAKFGVDLVNQMFGAMKSSGAYFMEVKHIKDAFMDVQSAVYAAFSPIVSFALPYIQQFARWLVVVLNTIAMILAALLQQKSVMQAVAGSANSMATAAQGALAAFDQLNVLQQAPVNNPGAGNFITAKVDASIVRELWDKTVLFITNLWTNFQQWFYYNIWLPVSDWFAIHVTGPIIELFHGLWLSISTGAVSVWTGIVNVFGPVGAWINDFVISPLSSDWKSLWATLSTIVYDWWMTVSFIFSSVAGWIWRNMILPVLANWTILIALSTGIWQGLWNFIVSLWTPAADWFTKNISPTIIAVFDGWKVSITKIWQGLWDGLGTIVRVSVNFMILIINNMLSNITTVVNGVVAGLNALGNAAHVPGWVAIPPISLGKIPYLATGAVIPPNAAYLAMVGDQKSGKNIETPEALMRQIVREEAGGKDANVTINFAGSLATLMQTLKPYADKENVRVGVSLIKTGATG